MTKLSRESLHHIIPYFFIRPFSSLSCL